MSSTSESRVSGVVKLTLSRMLRRAAPKAEPQSHQIESVVGKTTQRTGRFHLQRIPLLPFDPFARGPSRRRLLLAAAGIALVALAIGLIVGMGTVASRSNPGATPERTGAHAYALPSTTALSSTASEQQKSSSPVEQGIPSSPSPSRAGPQPTSSSRNAMSRGTSLKQSGDTPATPNPTSAQPQPAPSPGTTPEHDTSNQPPSAGRFHDWQL